MANWEPFEVSSHPQYTLQVLKGKENGEGREAKIGSPLFCKYAGQPLQGHRRPGRWSKWQRCLLRSWGLSLYLVLLTVAQECRSGFIFPQLTETSLKTLLKS
jgi:hypothetical protein